MEPVGYRSYVIRAWPGRGVGPRVARVVIEEVLSGRQVELRGDRAAEIELLISAACDARDEEAPTGDRYGRTPDPAARGAARGYHSRVVR